MNNNEHSVKEHSVDEPQGVVGFLYLLAIGSLPIILTLIIAWLSTR